MSAQTHTYRASVTWTGNTGTGTSSYTAYSREHVVDVAGKPPLTASADPAFRGDPGLHNPEEFLLAALSECHLLWYLGLCAASGVVVTAYRDEPVGTMAEQRDGGGRFTEVVLRPRVVVAEAAMVPRAEELHEQAHRKCFIANSVNFPVRHEPEVRVG
ncbi:OsmC family protein [Saccharopolyspora cebuensis]|uniref:OsmC family protein n=1 Tax=Saccharopolyspora cebuensis TaxID=418759 RepID=A0ABV4CNK1_9PSEU